jgi:hypothetical protein
VIRRQLLGVLIGVVAAAVGLLPWLLTGGRLPLQNLWATDTVDARAMPFVLLPFSQYAVLLIAALLVTGAAVAGLVARALPASRIGILSGLLAAQVVAVVQSAQVDGSGLQRTTIASLYLTLLVAVAIVSMVIGVAVLLLIALAPRGGAVIGFALAAVPFSSWAGSVLVPFGSISAAPFVVSLLEPVRFVPAVVIGVAVAWAGLSTVGRATAAIVALLILWVGPVLVTAIEFSAGSRVYAHDPSAMVEAGRSVFASALVQPANVLPPLVLAVVVALLGMVLEVGVRRFRRRPEPA